MKSSLLIVLIIVLSAVTVGCGNSEASTEATNAPTPAAPAGTSPATPAADAAQAAPSNSPDSNQGMVQLNAGEGSFK
jgi:C4-dicarboxylate transporter